MDYVDICATGSPIGSDLGQLRAQLRHPSYRESGAPLDVLVSSTDIISTAPRRIHVYTCSLDQCGSNSKHLLRTSTWQSCTAIDQMCGRDAGRKDNQCPLHTRLQLHVRKDDCSFGATTRVDVGWILHHMASSRILDILPRFVRRRYSA